MPTSLPGARHYEEALRAVAEEARPHAESGRVASYIPALERVVPSRFAVTMCDLDGAEVADGDADVGFSVQSIAKVFGLTLAMQRSDERLWERMGREPSGDPFNSLVQLEHERGRPRNPFINAGALVVTDVLRETCDDARATLFELIADLVGEPVTIDEEVYRSESETGARNRSLAFLMADFGNLHDDVEAVLDDYFHQSALVLTARQLARAVRFLANDGIDPGSGRRVLSALDARRVTALMLTCGTYDSAGEFAFRVGIPCKSGVGGGIVGVVPNRFGVCVWSPPLDTTGNSAAGCVALERLVQRAELSIF
jgi:glutaminase